MAFLPQGLYNSSPGARRDPILENVMRSILPRCLVLASSLLLALPPGWCCLALSFAPFAMDGSARSGVPACCQHKAKQKAADPKEAPKPLHHGECPCDD